MWEIRITEVSDSKVVDLCKSVEGRVIAVKEGEPFDVGKRSHVHIYIDETTKSDSYIRKKIQNMDKSRKGNDLYSMVNSHENSPNYVLKYVFRETKGDYQATLSHPRIVYRSDNILGHRYEDWYNRFVAYVSAIKQDIKLKKKVKKDSTMSMINEIAENNAEVSGLEPNDFIESVLEWHTDRELMLPSRSNMERYIITIYRKYKGNSNCLRSYYSIYFQ